MPLFSLDRDSSTPLYRQLRHQLERAIASGDFGNQRLPSSRALAVELGLSRNTVQLAYQELVAEGFVSAVPRSGLVVNPDVRRLLSHDEHPEPVRSVDWAGRLNDLRSAPGLPRVRKPADWYRYPYVFLGGQLSPATFPTKAWSNALRRALDTPHLVASLEDGGDRDDPMLVEQLCEQVLPARGISATPQEILVTSGSQHGLHLTATALVRPGDVAAVEEPGYPDAWHILSRAGASLLPLPVDEAGVVLPASLSGVGLAYLTPSHQFPTNATLSIGRRRDLLSRAARSDLVIIEDDYDSEFRFHGSPTPALKALEHGTSVVYAGSFSKFLAPGLRLGFLVGPPPLIEHLRDRRRYMVRHVSGHQQRALALLISSGQYARTLRRSRITLKARWTEFTSAVNDEILPGFAPPAGGTSVWLPLPEGTDPEQVAVAARARGLLLESGDTFFLDRGTPHLRMGLATIEAERIRPGVRLLRDVLGSIRH